MRRRDADLGGALELGPARAREVVADMGVAQVVARQAHGGLGRELDRLARELGFGQRASLGHLLDRMAVAVASREVHSRVDIRRVFAQGLLDEAQGLDELAPVHRPEQAQAADAVADRDLRGGLVLRFGLHHLLDVLVRLGEALLDPGQRQCECGAAALQAACELGDEGAGHRRVGARHVGDDEDQALRVLLGHVEHLVGPDAREVAGPATRLDARADAAQVLDQRESQHDRNRPQLAEVEHLLGLVRRDKAAQGAAADAAVAMCHRLQREVVDAWQARRWTALQARQLAAVARRQMALGGADLFFDEVEVVEQPFAGRGHAAIRLGVAREQRADLDQHLLVRRETSQQPIGRAPSDQLVRDRQLTAVLRHLIGGEQLGSQRGAVGTRAAAEHKRLQAGFSSQPLQPRPQPTRHHRTSLRPPGVLLFGAVQTRVSASRSVQT